MIFLVMTIAVGSAIAICLLRLPSRFCARLSASLTWSRLTMLPSVTRSLAQRLDRVALEPIGSLAGLGQLDQLYAPSS